MQNVSFNEQATTTQMVKTALHIACAHHEAELEKMNALLNDDASPDFERLMEIYGRFAEFGESKETAFRAFLNFLCE